MFKPIQHGEILLQPIKKMPAGKTEKHKSFIVGHSETGHHHVVESEAPFDVLTNEKGTYLSLLNPANLVHKKTHDKHKTLTLDPAIYEVHHKTEYNPFDKVTRDVKD